jgi:hypothetical protein
MRGRQIVLSPLLRGGTWKVVESNPDQTELQAPELDHLSFLQGQTISANDETIGRT